MMTLEERGLVWLQLRELYSADEAGKWLNKPHPLLHDKCPADCNFEDVMRVIDYEAQVQR